MKSWKTSGIFLYILKLGHGCGALYEVGRVAVVWNRVCMLSFRLVSSTNERTKGGMEEEEHTLHPRGPKEEEHETMERRNHREEGKGRTTGKREE